MKCIYCLQEKDYNGFTKAEHVIPEAFGKFKNNFVLHGVVCDECNQYFGNDLEIDLARDSYEGVIARYEHKIKKPSEFKSIGKRSRIKFIIKEGILKGSYAYQEYVPEKKNICLKPLPQVGFLRANSSEYDYFLLDEIPSAAYFDPHIYNINNPRGFIITGCDRKIAMYALRRKGFCLRLKQNQDSLQIYPGPFQSYGKTDKKIIRAIAKVGFNYSAYWNGPQFILQGDFDPIRKYIRTGQEPGYSVITISKTAILPEERGNTYRKLGHIIVIRSLYDKTLPFVFISLFNWATYAVCLADKYSGENKDIAKGHFFDLHNKSIVELRR